MTIRYLFKRKVLSAVNGMLLGLLVTILLGLRTFGAEKQYLLNIEQFHLTTSTLRRVVDDFKKAKDYFSNEHVSEVNSLLDSLFNTHLANLSVICTSLQALAASEGSISITEEFNDKSAPLLQCLKNLTNFLHKDYQLLIAKKTESQVALFDWLVVDEAKIDDVPRLLNEIAQDISAIPASLCSILDDVVNLNNYELNDMLCNCDISPLQSTLAILSTSICNFPTTEINNATKRVLDTAASAFAGFSFEHKVCAAEYADSLARLENITSAINAQVRKIDCKDFSLTKAYAEEHYDEVLAPINGITSAINAISQAVGNIAALPHNCIMNRQLIAETRGIQTQLKQCFDYIENLYNTFWGGPSGTEILASSVHYTFADIPDVLARIEDNIGGTIEGITQIFAAFSKHAYEQHIGTALTVLESSILALGEACSGSSETSLRNVIAQHGNTVCSHELINLGTFFQKIGTILCSFPTINTQLCCSKIFSEMQGIHNSGFKTLRLLKTLVDADEMYQPNKHTTWIQVFSGLNQFITSLFVEGNIDSTKPDQFCHNARLISYLSQTDTNFKSMADSLELLVQSLNLPNFAPDFSVTYTNRGCEAIAFFMNGIAQVVTGINALFPTLHRKFNDSSYAVDEVLLNAITSFTPELKTFIGQFGSKIPLLSTLCATCDHATAWSTIHDGVLALANSLDNFAAQQLATPRCCRDPASVFLKIGENTQRLSQVIQRLPISTSSVSPDTGNSLVADFNRGTELLSCILAQVKEMKRPRTEDDSTCLMQRLLPKLNSIDPLLQNLLSVSLDVYGKLGGSAFEFEIAAPESSDDFCGQLNEVLELMKTSLAQLAGNIDEASLRYSGRRRAFYSDEYFDSFQSFLGAFKSIVQEVALLSQVGVDCHVAHAPFFVEELQAIETALGYVSAAIKSFCCSNASESFYLIRIYLKQLKILTDATSQYYAIDLPPPNLDKLRLLLQNCDQVNRVLREIINIKDTLVDDSCNFQKIDLHLRALIPQLNENRSVLMQFMRELGITDFLEAIPSDLKFCSKTVATHAAGMATEYKELTEALTPLAAKIRQSPPVRANYVELLSFLANGKDMLTALGETISFLVDRFKGSLPIPLCSACSTLSTAPPTPTAPVVAALDDIIDVITHPGCCVLSADQVVTTANFLRRFQHVLYSLNQLEQISLHASHEQNFLSFFDTLLARLGVVQQSLASIIGGYALDGACATGPLQPLLQVLNENLLDIEDSVVTLAKTLGAKFDFSSVAGMTPDRTISGCEMLAIALEDCESSMQQCVQLGRGICDILLRANTRQHRPQLLSKLDSLSSITSSIYARLAEVADIVATNVSCQSCLLTRERQALSQFVKYFEDFTHVIGDDSGASVRGILRRYCSSIQNTEALNVIQVVRNIQRIIKGITSHDAIFQFSRDYSIVPFLTELQESYAALVEAMSSVPTGQCGDFAALSRVSASVQHIHSKFVRLAAFLGCSTADEGEPLSLTSTFYQAGPQLTDLACKLFSQIAADINQLVYKMSQRQVSYANNPRITEFLDTIINIPLIDQLTHIYGAFACYYCDYSSAQIVHEFQKVKDALTALKNAFACQTYLAEFEVIGSKIAQQSLEIIQMCTEFINDSNAKFVVNDALKNQVQTFGNFLISLKAFLLSVLNNEPLESCLQNLDAASVSTLHSVVKQFIENLGIKYSAVDNTLALRGISSHEQIATFFSAISKVDESFAKMLSVSKKLKVITYTHDLIELLKEVNSSIESFPAAALGTLENSARQFPLFSLSPLYSADLFPVLGGTLRSVQSNITGIISELQAKCCSEFEFAWHHLLHEGKRCTSFIKSIVFDPEYIDMFSDTGEVHELLAHLCGSSGLIEVIDYIRQISTTLTASAAHSDADACITQTIVPIFRNLTLTLNLIAQKCQDFYITHHLGAALSDLSEAPFGASEEDMMNELIATCTELNSAINYLNGVRLRPKYALNRQLTEFVTMFQLLNELSDAIFALHDAKVRTCPRHAQWPSVQLTALAALFRPADVVIEEVQAISCCAEFANESAIFANRLAAFEPLHDAILSYFESQINSHSASTSLFSAQQMTFPAFEVDFWADHASFSNSHMREFCQVLQNFTQYVCSLSSNLSEMTDALSRYAQNESCLATICVPHMRATNNVMLNLLQFARDILGVTVVDKDAVDANLNCESRRQNLRSVLHSFGQILARWGRFRDVWVGGVHTLQYHDTLSAQVRGFVGAIVQLRQYLSAWKDANYVDGNSVFCLMCNDMRADEFEDVVPVDEFQPIFEQIAAHADACCSSITHLAIRNIRRNLGNIAIFLGNIGVTVYNTSFPEPEIAKGIFNALFRGDEECRDHIFQIVFSNSKFWTNMLAYAKCLINTVLDLEKISGNGRCPSYALNPVLAQLDDTVEKIRNALRPFATCDADDASGEDDDSLAIADNMSALAVSWSALCGALDEKVPDSVRVFLAKVINEFNEDLFVLYDHIPSFKSLMGVEFCGGPVLVHDITSTVGDVVKKMIFRNARLLPNLWAHNCCDGHAKCVYCAGKQLEYFNALLASTPLGYELIRQICDCMGAFSRKINEVQFKMDFIAPKEQPIHCLFSYATPEFEQLSMILEQSITSVDFHAQAYPSWDELSASTRNDCDSLQDLYDTLSQRLTSSLAHFVAQLSDKNPNVILGVRSAMHKLTSSLNELLQSMQRYEGTYGPLCQSCQHHNVTRGLTQIVESFSVASQQLRLIVDHPNILKTHAILNETTSLIRTYFDTDMDDMLWQPLEDINARTREADEAVALLAEAMGGTHKSQRVFTVYS
ncbi:MAG: hypothetical protein LBF66_02720 [Holosporales bacterium]|nr:hypothetical protein [Holosporales bacterium]